MKIFISGGSGFVGNYLSSAFLKEGHHICAVGTSAGHALSGHPGFSYISADMTQPGSWQDGLQDADIVINLAGRTIFKRWSRRYKAHIYDSRIVTTRNIVDGLPKNNSSTLISASAAGYYGDRGDEVLTEQSTSGKDFLSQVCIDWERETFSAEKKGARAVSMRFGVILGKNGGAFAMMRPLFKFGLGGPTGNGRHWFPWIHLEDLVAAVNFLIATPMLRGPVNFTSATPVRNRQFAKFLGKALSRPAFLPAPAFMMKLVMGELGRALLNSQQVIPEKLMRSGFRFQYPTIESALEELTGKN